MWQGMKSVVLFSPEDTKQERIDKFNEWTTDSGRAIPDAQETLKMLYGDSK